MLEIVERYNFCFNGFTHLFSIYFVFSSFFFPCVECIHRTPPHGTVCMSDFVTLQHNFLVALPEQNVEKRKTVTSSQLVQRGEGAHGKIDKSWFILGRIKIWATSHKVTKNALVQTYILSEMVDYFLIPINPDNPVSSVWSQCINLNRFIRLTFIVVINIFMKSFFFGMSAV